MKTLKLSAPSESATVAQAIANVIANTELGRERTNALKSVKWVLRSGSMYVGSSITNALDSTLTTNRDNAMVFDGRDNEEMKARFFSVYYGAPFIAELL